MINLQHILQGVCLQSSQEYPQGENVVVQREGPHGHDELHFRVLCLVYAPCLHLLYRSAQQSRHMVTSLVQVYCNNSKDAERGKNRGRKT